MALVMAVILVLLSSDAFAKYIEATDYDFKINQIFTSSEGRIVRDDHANYSWPQQHNFLGRVEQWKAAVVKYGEHGPLYLLGKNPIKESKETERHVLADSGIEIQLDLNTVIDADKFFALNAEAAEIWDHFIEKCNVQYLVFHQVYTNPELCKKEKENLLKFKIEVHDFLIGDNVRPFKYSDTLECIDTKSGAELPPTSCEMDKEFGGYADLAQYVFREPDHYQRQDLGLIKFISDEVFKSMATPTIHPYMFQVVLELLAEGFPFPYAGWSGIDFKDPYLTGATFGLLGRKRRYQVIHGNVKWSKGLLGPRVSNKKRQVARNLIELTQQILDSGELPTAETLSFAMSYKGKPVMNRWAIEFRNRTMLGFAAEQLLHIMTNIQPERDTWGLYPDLSVQLIQTAAMTERSYGHFSSVDSITPYSSLILIKDKMNGKFLKYKGEFNNRDFYHDHSAYIGLLKRVGAWRQLRYFE